MSEDLVRRSARDVVAMLSAGDITPHDTLDAVEERMDEVDGMVNALPTRCFDRARRHVDQMADSPPDQRGPLAGLPAAIKDLSPVAGVRNTFGSRIRENFIPEQSDILVEKLEDDGAVVYAMSNTPEFGIGGNTFNDVFGPTRNPNDLRLTAGGSSGGSAAALASGTAWIATGSDLAGSLRTPANFCGVTSLRPSPGLIASGPSAAPFLLHAQSGPMARDIGDLALFADSMTGISQQVGVSKPRPERPFAECVRRATKPLRVAFSRDLGVTSTQDVVADLCLSAMQTLETDGIEVVEDHPDLSEAAKAFSVTRGLLYANNLGPDLEQIRDILKPELVWNIEHGLNLTGDDFRSALVAQGNVFNSAARFMADHDLLVSPASAVLPFPIEERYFGYSDGVPWSEYNDWLFIVSAISATTLPVITLPVGRTESGLPVGVQLVGKPHGEDALFSYAAYLEQLLGFDQAVVDPSPIS
ncbi:MAG: amidase [Actinomycetia bacterium]|nr:amidase [Actinomycetes bacterium]